MTRWGVVLFALASVVTPRDALARWKAGVEFGVGHAVSSRPVFEDVATAQVFGLRRLGESWAVGLASEYRYVLGREGASSFWFADLVARAELQIVWRLWARVDAGIGWRHIGLSGGYSNTVAQPVLGGGVGGTVLAGDNWNLFVCGLIHSSLTTFGVSWTTTDLGGAAGWATTW